MLLRSLSGRLRNLSRCSFSSSQTFQNVVKAKPKISQEILTSKLIIDEEPKSIDQYQWNKRSTSLTLKQKLECYAALSKKNLTGLVVLTCIGGYMQAPNLIPFDPVCLLCVSVGTALTSAAANSINQYLESPYDSQMKRTKNRVLVQMKMSPLNVINFASISAISGILLLSVSVSPIVASLGFINLLLYTNIYTPMKRLSIYNTWIGSIVGAIPPMMGWLAAVYPTIWQSELIAEPNLAQINLPAAMILPLILYSWQFPHFNALSWNIKNEYTRAGYRMASVVQPMLCRRTALRHSILLLALCSIGAPLTGFAKISFAIDTIPFNVYFIYLAFLFYKEGSSLSARRLFRFSLIYLPIIMVLAFISK
ncbi:hypothetical protein SNEBB_010036 [Seison nebaliae]|nr:hypothetical protein SNEBB_010036 [Seison nebaliae]